MKTIRIAVFTSFAMLFSAFDVQPFTGYRISSGKVKCCAAAYDITTEEKKQGYRFDPYSVENKYDITGRMFESQNGVDYGTVLHDVEYWSSTADDYKQCNILLPAGYDESEEYPVMYVIHGWSGDHTNQIDDESYLTMLYGNMLHYDLTVPMIIVNVDMYTDKASEKAKKSNLERRYIYDKVVDDIAVDLMPFIEKNYPVKTGRENTAVAGVSQGASEALCTGFKWLDKFGYISGYAPDAGVIPTKWFEGTFWNIPYFEQFPTPDEDTVPYYVYMSVGDEDPENVDITLYYSQVLNELGVKNQTDLVKGYGHNTLFWKQSFYNFLLKTFRTEEIPVHEPEQGDINNDWDIDIVDVVMIINYINGISPLTDEQIILADVDKSLTVDIEDAVTIISHINGIKPLSE